jgi:hypothetical protein
VVRRVEYSEVNYKVVEEGGSNLQSADDVGGVTLPDDWTFVEGELFADTLRAEWTRSNGDSIVLTPYPIVTETVHSVSYSGSSSISREYGEWTKAVDGALHMMADNTNDSTFRILDRDVNTIQTFQDAPPIDVNRNSDPIRGIGSGPSEIANPADVVNVDCEICGESSLLLEHQEMSMSAGESVEVIYRCRCPTCSSVVEIQETRNETW